MSPGLRGLVDYWSLDVPWGPTPFWLRWLGKPKYRAHENDWKSDGTWLYSDHMPSYGGIDRSQPPFWKTRNQ